MKNVGSKLKLARAKSGFSQIEIISKLKHERINITQPYLSMIEKGKREPNLVLIKTFAKIYNIDVLDLIFTKEERYEILSRYQYIKK